MKVIQRNILDFYQPTITALHACGSVSTANSTKLSSRNPPQAVINDINANKNLARVGQGPVPENATEGLSIASIILIVGTAGIIIWSIYNYCESQRMEKEGKYEK